MNACQRELAIGGGGLAIAPPPRRYGATRNIGFRHRYSAALERSASGTRSRSGKSALFRRPRSADRHGDIAELRVEIIGPAIAAAAHRRRSGSRLSSAAVPARAVASLQDLREWRSHRASGIVAPVRGAPTSLGLMARSILQADFPMLRPRAQAGKAVRGGRWPSPAI